jgi:1-phosphatidylinositol phosphodiesterase
MLESILAFLAAHPRETLIACIQQESSTPSPDFSALVHRAMAPSIAAGKWYLENRIPSLGEVRGRAILLSRFGGSPRDGGETPWLVQPPAPEPHYYEGESFAPRGEPVVRMGWRPERWPYSALDGFEWHDERGMRCRTQDWCEIYGFFNVAAKFNIVRRLPRFWMFEH